MHAVTILTGLSMYGSGMLDGMPASENHESKWLTPEWSAPHGVRALCTTRCGGFSGLPYDTLNLGSHVGDDAPTVARNRAVLQRAVAARPVFLNQVHGTQVLELDATTADDLPTDGAFTRIRGLVCTVMVADCLPVLLCDRSGSMVAAVHAGWRGLAGSAGNGILEQAYKCFMPEDLVEYEYSAIEIIAWLGPCIGPLAFEVGVDVVTAFTRDQPHAMQHFASQRDGKWLANLPALARQRLNALGITQVFGNDGSPPWCTASNPSRFFSHRRDGVSGRQAACIWLE
jgi:YfiH family protein